MSQGTIISIIIMIVYIVCAPLVGGLLDGMDRKLTARMQGRRGPSILQPFYDVSKLFKKELLLVNRGQLFLVFSYLIFMILTGALFYAGTDLLLCFFALSTAAMFLILASTTTHSPYATQGSNREMLQMMAYEPMVLLTAVGFYQASGSFQVHNIIKADLPAICYIPGFFIGFVFILTIKFRKSPFDLSTSHHAHQEIVKGVTTEMEGMQYGMTTLAEWYEVVFLLGVVGLFFMNSQWWSILIAIAAILVVYFLEILIDNTSARVKWQLTMKLAWGVTIVAGGINLLVLMFLK